MVPSCPRCGYDQSGAIASWNTDASASCPLRGTCSECGLTFWWHDVIHADRLIVRGFVEHARGFWQTWRWAWVTWAWTLWPPVFWARVKIEQPPHVRRVLEWPILWAGFAWVGIALIQEAALLDALRGGYSSAWSVVSNEWRELSQPWIRWIFRYNNGWPVGGSWTLTFDAAPPLFLSGLGSNVIAALVLWVAPFTRRRAKIRMAHVLRAAVYGLSAIWTAGIFGAASAVLELVELKTGSYSWNAHRLFDDGWVWVSPLQAAWLVVWWQLAIREMFRKQANARIVAIMTLVVVLGAAMGMALSYRFASFLARQ